MEVECHLRRKIWVAIIKTVHLNAFDPSVMASAYYYNQQQAGGAHPPSMNQQQPPRGIPGQIGINPTPQHYLQQQQQQQQYRNQAMNDSHRKRSQAKVVV